VAGERRGVTPMELSLPRGRVHELELRHEGFSATSHPVDLTSYPGPVKNEDVSLQSLPKATPTRPPPPVTVKKKKGDDIPVFE
jgi:hypothetical protein